MPVLFFPNSETVRVILGSEILPKEVRNAPVWLRIDEKKGLWVAPFEPLERVTITGLQKYGVQVYGQTTFELEDRVSCWHQLLEVQEIPFSPGLIQGEILIDIPSELFPIVAKELNRLYEGSFSYRWQTPPQEMDEENLSAQRVFLRITNPPYFTIARMLDRSPKEHSSMRAYTRAAPNVWVQLGWNQRLVEGIRIAPNKWLFIRENRDWEWIDPGEWISMTTSLAIPSHKPVELLEGNRPNPISVSIRLVPLRQSEPTELWIIRQNPEEQLVQLSQRFDERMLDRFRFAIGNWLGEPCLILQSRRKKGPPPVLLIEGEEYRSYLRFANLFVPCGYRFESIPRRDVLTSTLNITSSDLVILHRMPTGEFRVERIPDAVFQNLRDWVEFHSETLPVVLKAWKDENDWEFDSFTVRNLEDIPKPSSPEPIVQPSKKVSAKAKKKLQHKSGPSIWIKGLALLLFPFALFERLIRGKAKPKFEVELAPEPISVEKAVRKAIRPLEDRLQLPDSNRSSATLEQITILESKFLDQLTAIKEKDRCEVWQQLAAAYEQSENYPDATLCWLNAVWEAKFAGTTPEQFTQILTYGWFRAEAKNARLGTGEIKLDRWLSFPPKPEITRAIAAYAYWGANQENIPTELLKHLTEIQAKLESHEDALPIRAAWLTRFALAKLVQGDVLGLARTRDRLLDRLFKEGLSLALDTPAFLRFASAGVSKQFQEIREWLLKKRKSIHDWINKFNSGGKLQKMGLDPEVEKTHGYVDLILAWGLARFRENQKCDDLIGNARSILPNDDPAHHLLRQAFEYRIREIREGSPEEEKLPTQLRKQFDRDLQKIDPKSHTDFIYVVDKLLQHSRSLEPSSQIDAYWASIYEQCEATNELQRQLNGLKKLDRSVLNEAVLRLLSEFESPSTTQAMIVEKILDVGTRLDETVAKQLLSRTTKILDSHSISASPKELLRKGMFVAAHFNELTIVKNLANRFLGFLEKQQGRAGLVNIEELTEGTYRSFSRVGMKLELQKFLGRVAEWILRGESFAIARKRFGSNWSLALRTLLHVASGWYLGGQDDEAFSIIELARRDLYDKNIAMTPKDRTDLALTYANTLGHVPMKVALGRFEEMFKDLNQIHVKGSTNTHFTLSMLQLVEGVVFAVVNKDFTLGPSVRGWLDEDEYRVRQRIHNDLRALMKDEGM
jgi:cellulose synthase operon protein C